MPKIVIDPVTRIEGHLRIEAQVENNRVVDAWSAGTMIRGLEVIVQNRDPRDVWIFVERICGVCTLVHAMASVRAVEDAVKVRIPKNANLIRNIMFCTQLIHDHVVHFYHLHALDWVDVVNALKADPKATAALAQTVSPGNPRSSAGYFKDTQDRLKALVDSGQLGIFTNGYWGHPAYKLPPEANLLAVAHYLEALTWQKDIVKIHTVFGGRNPHPNFLVGGVPCSLDPNSDDNINIERLNLVNQMIELAAAFVEQVYVPDLLAIASFYKDVTYGGGLPNYLCFGDLPTDDISNPDSYLFPRGVILNRNLSEVLECDPTDPEQIKEYIDHSWYEYSGDSPGRHPWEGETTLKYTGPKGEYQELDLNGKYSWLKAPRWRDHPMEVGPLARCVVAYAKGMPEWKDTIDLVLTKLGLPVSALFSTLGRTAARGIETKLTVHYLRRFYDELIANIQQGDIATFNPAKWDPGTWSADCKGVGICEAPRGALGHWIHIKNGKTFNYQAVVPTTWNASPRDEKGQRGAYEASLIGTPLANPDQPVEILRTIHSFDPCLACGIHLLDCEKKEITRVTVLN
ncbi:MAG: nickel-dependent hydrogenase large subunit [Heliobacteriaceae bacterium]|nr:nickel-dependent hydrogenase large subunit [Heliobacteriaceae bacterium]MDD4587092.1 nickel-dependent hydrogenase large subunit [Heliobacteriaceae bacterium]